MPVRIAEARGRARVTPPHTSTPPSVEPLGAPRRQADAAARQRSRWPLIRDGLAVLLVVLGILFGIVVFLPAEGRVAGPLHDWIALLLGQATFLLPLGLVVAGACVLLHSLAPDTPLPLARLLGAVLVALGALPTMHLLGLPEGGSLARAEARSGAGFVGHWMSSGLLEWFGWPMTVVVLAAALVVGSLLVFDLTITQAVRWTYLGSWLSVRLLGRGARRVYRRRGVVRQVGEKLPSAVRPLHGLAARHHVARPAFVALRRHAPHRLGTPGAQRLLSMRPAATASGIVDTARASEPRAARLEPASQRELMNPPSREQAGGPLGLPLGRGEGDVLFVADLSRMPHLLVAGAPDSGVSTGIDAMLTSLLAQLTPDKLQVVLVDSQAGQLRSFSDAPHLCVPLVAGAEDALAALQWVEQEMERRYKLFAAHGVRNLEGYNRRALEAQHSDEPSLPFLVVVVGELAELMTAAAEDVQKILCRLAQLARATGIHLVIATQHPTVDVLTGVIRANFPTRLAFAVASQTESRVILDQAGAETLRGDGDALFLAADAVKPVRLQVTPASDEESGPLLEHWKRQGRPPAAGGDSAQAEVLTRADEDEDDSADQDVEDDVYDRAVELAEAVGRLSVSLLQRRLSIGAARAQRLLDRLVQEGVADP